MSRNKFSLVLVILVIIAAVYFINKNENEVHPEESKSISTSLNKPTQYARKGSKLIKVKDVKGTLAIKRDRPGEVEKDNNQISGLINKVKDDSSECDNRMQDVFGSEEKNIDLTHYTEYEIRELFGKFNTINFSSSAMPDLMNELSIVDKKLDEEEMQELANIKPCRIFQKINFLDELRKLVSNTDNESFKKDLTQMLFKYFEKEVSSSYSVANLTMTMNMMESFIQEGVVPDAEGKSTALEEIVDSLEQDYEDVLSRAEESLEGSDNESFISNKLIQDEIKLNKKYKKLLLDFIQSRL